MARHCPDTAARANQTVHDVAAQEAAGADNHNPVRVFIG